MTQAVSRILEEAARLSVEERAELMDLMVERFDDEAFDIGPPDLAEIHRRLDEVESGAVKLISAEEAEATVRGIIEAARTGR